MLRLTLVRQIAALLLIPAAAAVLPACSQSDASSLKLTLRQDLSGELLTSSVALREARDGPVQTAVSGADWKAAGTLVVARGEFADVGKLNIGGISFTPSVRGGAPVLRVTIERGSAAKWPDAFTVTDREARKNTALTLDPSAKASSIGEAIKLQISVPGQVISAGTDNKERGVNSSYEETLATLIIPARVAIADGRPITWHITWKEQTVP
jgi:hypothetical protein